ncbi:hypothetical protein [Rubinisphaera italica]|uniref:Uncharacterized protein n=1 Tax=Rubinisphaera italica TaxID=2527969 RepID=A0A5C5XE41_9PLAN|nr:hypothetical protein [Rubinisphaera italica]TWT61317.1 hypothetical protein Pan54_20530 [Rubinisphaera italica]
MVGRYAHAKQFRRMRNRLRKMKTWLGLVIRDVRRKMPQPDAALQELPKPKRQQDVALNWPFGDLKPRFARTKV